uniref:Transmembrane protein n=1 Tax=Hemiselmis tepida TaxID=464990 RepID=A0A7S0YYF7_9CRYP|mmetsp:Transcript_31984/g.81417  ORF Transcript_31984/g.81417 Transcript_31984/m.81417 type:complete len:389 (+) Transcript_31984:389-1555(+)
MQQQRNGAGLTSVEPEPGHAEIRFDSPQSATSGLYPGLVYNNMKSQGSASPPAAAEPTTPQRARNYSMQPPAPPRDAGDGLDDEDDQHLEDLTRPQFQGVPENTYAAAIFAVLVIRRADITVYAVIPMAISWIVQMFFVAWLSRAYLDNPPALSREALEGTAVMPQLVACGYFIANMVSTLEWLWVSAYVCLFATRYRVGEGDEAATFDLATRKRVTVGADGGETLQATRSSRDKGGGGGFMAVRAAAFVLCSLAEVAVWVSILLVGVQYIMWSGQRGETESARVASVLGATLSFTWILGVDEKVFQQVTPVKMRERMRRVRFQVRPLTLAGSGQGSGGVGRSLGNAAVFLTPSVLLVGAAVAAVFLVRAGAIIDTTGMFEGAAPTVV